MNDQELLQDFYASLENINSFNIWAINKTITNFNKRFENANLENCLLIERKVLSYNLHEGALISSMRTTLEDGSVIDNISLEDDEIKYIILRTEQTNNKWLLSRYSHLLWQHKKNNKYAKSALDVYLQLVTSKSIDVLDLNSLLFTLNYISKKIKYKVEETKQMFFLQIKTQDNLSKCTILETALKTSLFDIADLKELATDCLEWVDIKNRALYFHSKRHLQNCVSLYEKIKLDTMVIYEMLASNEDHIISQHKEDESFVKIIAIGEKAKYLNKAKNEIEYKNTLIEYNRLKQTVKLGRMSIPIEGEGAELLNLYLKIVSSQLLNQPTNQILGFFAANEDVVVDPNENLKFAAKNINKSIYHFTSTTIFDINTNFKKLEKDKVLDYEVLNAYTISYNIRFYTLFLRVFVDGIICGKINYHNIYDFLKQHTWFGMKFKRSITGENSATWLSLLAPSIYSFISQFEYSTIMSNNKINNYILAIDSMTLKFEGALRDFIRLSGGSTSVEKNKGDFQEQLLDELLENDITKKYFSPGDIELFKYAFTRKGKNIRNNVAHSFYGYNDYDLQTISLVFFCILRLGKYTFEPI